MNFQLIRTYLKEYWITSSLIGYMLITTILKSYTSIDMTIPCVILYSTNVECYGCGLTTAMTHLFKLDILAAFEANPLIFIALPLLTYFIIRHWNKFEKREKSKSESN